MSKNLKNQIRIVGGPSTNKNEHEPKKMKMGRKSTFRERLRARKVSKQDEKTSRAKERQIEDFR